MWLCKVGNCLLFISHEAEYWLSFAQLLSGCPGGRSARPRPALLGQSQVTKEGVVSLRKMNLLTCMTTRQVDANSHPFLATHCASPVPISHRSQLSHPLVMRGALESCMAIWNHWVHVECEAVYWAVCIQFRVIKSRCPPTGNNLCMGAPNFGSEFGQLKG